MHVFDTPGDVRAWSLASRGAGRRVGIVPTMGALHAGHLALIDAVRERADDVVVTIFVNPLQFNERTDFDRYPRPIDDDLAACRDMGVVAVYAPTAATMYPPGYDTKVEPGELASRLEGPMRPGHFTGVATVVTKLFGATVPHVAAFGAKDFQQLAIIRRMVADLDLGIEVLAVPIMREHDGLALSSRNLRLTPDLRSAAPVIGRALRDAAVAFAAGERSGPRLAEAVHTAIADEPLARVEYVEVADPESLEPVTDERDRMVLLVAAWFGDVRLIDNHLLAAD